VRLTKRQKGDYWWIVQRCLVEFFSRTPLQAREIVTGLPPFATPEGEEATYDQINPWEMAACLVEGKESLTPAEQTRYEEILEEVYGEM
jgi:hypothetical protein